MLIAIPPTFEVAQVVGFMKGKSAIHLARVYGGGSATSWGSGSGRVVISCPRWGAMKR